MAANRPGREAGISLIEVMIALVISGLLALGLVQIFAASKATSNMTEGLSRVQENGRFATQFLARQLRMVGFMGCGSDNERSTQASFVNHLSLFADNSVPGGNKFRFQRPIEAYTQGSMDAPAELASLTNVVDGSDVLILRIFSEESTPVVSIDKTGDILTLLIGDPTASFLPAPNDNVTLGLQNCRSADVFVGSLNGTVPGSAIVIDGRADGNVYLDPSVSSCGTAPCPWDFRISNAFLNSKPLVGVANLNAEVHRVEYYAFYVKSAVAGAPSSLWMQRFNRDDTELNSPEELVEGVENMQLRFGVDTSTNPMGDGAVDEYRTAEDVVAGATDEAEIDQNWRRVLSVRVALLLRSPERASVPAGSRTFRLIDTDITPTATDDGAIREVYDTTISLRNRLFKS
jgi:type IV pilus assembly protein PilW